MPARTLRTLLTALAVAAPLHAAVATEDRPGLQRCRLLGVEHEAWCGSVRRPLDPASPQGRQIDVHYAVLPALARSRKPDPVVFFAGGPGQSAIDLARSVSALTSRLSNRRDVILVDQRGTGRSAPLACDDPPLDAPLADALDEARQLVRLAACRERLQALPHGDLRHYTTAVAVQDVEAVRQALGAERLNLIGGSYGTRAALEYLRQYPQAVRRAVIDGVAPPDMVLPAAGSPDNQAAFDAVLAACEAEAACRERYPSLRRQWQALLAGLPRRVDVAHPLTGRPESVVLTREAVLSLVRAALYVPAHASALPLALHEAGQGRYGALFGLASAMGGRDRSRRLYEGMHFSVVCAEDLPRLAQATDRPGGDWGGTMALQYERICAGWPRAAVPPAFYTVPASSSPVLVLSGGADPVTPPRHGERVARALGPQARHVVVPQAGHGVMALGCMRDVVFRFIDADDSAQALQVDAGCATAVPRPPAFMPLLPEARP